VPLLPIQLRLQRLEPFEPFGEMRARGVFRIEPVGEVGRLTIERPPIARPHAKSLDIH